MVLLRACWKQRSVDLLGGLGVGIVSYVDLLVSFTTIELSYYRQKLA